MFRTIFIGLWACVATLGATYGGAYWRMHQNTAPAAEHAEKLDVRKLKPITVPVIADGVLRGYVSAEFSMVGPQADKHEHTLDPESFFLDEAFRVIYSESKIDFSDIQKADLSALTSQITANVNQRMGKNVVKETLVRNFTFVPREDMPR
ncbi:flagellar basal body-associated protein FliL [Methylocystis sp. WRRC1]|uniref:flagellar basal body-associated protein FliL n=1 Tax=Methylocystis sp. WRRC1 TaxID=1732014 RepID=UPI001D1360ED|nr:flagellar basal body-associated protein FliL [Methylocystis sp. WRRC1]MCC3244895.1 flagellar basal body-associated protein FliL [Methylocystis sp. WRRC1]